MAFGEGHPKRIRNAFVRACLDDGMSVAEAHALATEGRLPGVRPDEVPPIGTCRSWRTDAARERETAAAAGTDEGAGTIVDEALSMAAMALREQARRLARKRPRASPAEWADLAKAAGAVGKARREANGTERAKRTPRTPDAPDDTAPAQDSGAWVDTLDPDA